MIRSFPKPERVAYGTHLELVLLPKLSEYLNQPIKKTTYEYSLLDFSGQHFWAELKVRTSDYHYSDPKIKEEGWLIPACKIRQAQLEYYLNKKDVYFFYLWERDSSLWVYKYNPQDFVALKSRIPQWHLDKQHHYFLPESCWKLISFLKIDYPKRGNKCLISDDD